MFANGTVISAAVGGKGMTNPQSGSQWGFGLEPSEPPGREGLDGWLARALWTKKGSRCLADARL